MSVNIREIAKRAGVSPSTVSRYFSGKTIVSDELAKRIAEVADELNYRPRQCAPKREGVIVVLTPKLCLEFFNEVINYIIDASQRFNLGILILPTNGDSNEYKSVLKDVYVRGVIYLDEDIDIDILRYIRAKNILVVMLGGASIDDKCSMVHINDMAAAYEGMKYLLYKNHREILLISDYPKSLSSGFQRITGCEQALKEFGLTLDKEKMIKYGFLTFEQGYRSTCQALAEKLPFSAIFAFSDESAQGAIAALHDKGLKVPDDISVLGFDGLAISERMLPRLTTIAQPLKKMVEITLKILTEEHDGWDKDKITYTLPYALIERDTCIERRTNLA